MFPNGAWEVFYGSEASKNSVIEKLPYYTYLHFSCHGVYDWKDILTSGLVLAESNTLTLSEIISPAVDLNNTRLVVLSACETGLIDLEDTPEEYVGLPAGFIQSGVPGVISSLWAVDDMATSLLIERFYYYHLNEKMYPSRALREAQIWLSNITRADLDKYYSENYPYEYFLGLIGNSSMLFDKPYSSPYFWAGFTYVGA